MIITRNKYRNQYKRDLAGSLLSKLRKQRKLLCDQWDADGQRTGTVLCRQLDESSLMLELLKDFLDNN